MNVYACQSNVWLSVCKTVVQQAMHVHTHAHTRTQHTRRGGVHRLPSKSPCASSSLTVLGSGSKPSSSPKPGRFAACRSEQTSQCFEGVN